MIIWDDGFFTELDDNRILAITGRLSSGKSLLAIELAERYLKRGYKLVSQMTCAWNDEPETVEADELGRRHVVAIVDEGGLYFRTSKSSNSVSSFAAKMDSYIIFSGRKLPHESLCSLTCQVWFDFWKNFLIPVKLWRYDVENGRKAYHGFFWQTGWWVYWGIYDTLDPGDFPETIVTYFKRWAEVLFEKYGRKYQVSDVETGGREDGSELVEFSNDLSQSVRVFSDAAKAVSKSKTGRRF